MKHVFTFLFGLTISASLLTTSHAQSIRYVKQGGTGDGSSWAAASGDLQAMIYDTGAEQVWVAAGRYQPINRVFPSFNLYVGVAVYGGFVGNETKLSERPNVDPVGGQPSSTTLVNDGYPVIANRGLTPSASLDGVVITGNAGGIMNFNSSPRLTNCLITNNTTARSFVSGNGSSGAGMLNTGSNPVLVNCVISNNKTDRQGSGGGIYNGSASNPRLTNCIISGNHAEVNGGGIYNEGGSLVLTDCIIANNIAEYSIGPGRGPGNFGAGIYCATGSTVTAFHCTIYNNYALDEAGGIYSANSTLNLSNCIISRNGAGGRSNNAGGAIVLTGGTTNLVNCLIARSYIYGYATNAGIINSNNTLNMTNCTLVGTRSNVPYPYYQGRALTTDGRTQLTNCILWDNGSAEDTGLGSGLYGPATVTYSLLQVGNSGYTGTSTNNIITTVSPFDATENYTLSACSAAIDAGDPSTTSAVVGTTDVYGQPRFYQGGRIDIGASEFQGPASQPVAITSQPPSGSAVCAGNVVSAAVATTGTVGSYQWYKDGAVLTSVASATTATLTLPAATTTDSGNYVAVITGSCNSLTTTAFSLTVNSCPTAPIITVQVYSATKDGPLASQVQTRLEVRNTSTTAMAVGDLKLRYYFTSDNNQTANVYVDYASIGAQNVAATVVRLPTPVSGADSYVELSFPGSPLTLAAQSSLGFIDFRIVRSDYGLLNQENDYSYLANYGSVVLNNQVTAYLNNSRIFGMSPSGAARVAASESVSGLSVRVLGNPVPGASAQVEIRGAEGQAVSLRLVDLQGRSIHEQRIEQAAETETVSVPLGSSRGALFLTVNTTSQQQSLKLLRP